MKAIVGGLWVACLSILTYPAQADQICPDMPPTSGSNEQVQGALKLGFARFLNLVDTNGSYKKEVTSLMKDDQAEFKLITMVMLCRAGQQRYPNDPDKQIELIISSFMRLFPSAILNTTAQPVPSTTMVPKENLPIAEKAEISTAAASNTPAQPFINSTSPQILAVSNPDKKLPPRDQWRQVYFRPINKGTWHVFVASVAAQYNPEESFDKIVSIQHTMENRFPNVAFRPLATSNMAGGNVTWSLTIGHGLDQDTADTLTAWARKNIVPDAYDFRAAENFDDAGGPQDFHK